MKKFLTAFLAILTAAAMSGCGNSPDNQIMEEVLKDIPNVTVPTESRAFSGADEEVIPVSEETNSGTESTAEEASAAVIVEYDDSIFPVGEWVDVSETDETFYSFDEDGRFEIGLQTHSIFGKYTFENNLLTLNFDIGFAENDSFHAEYAFNVQREESGYRLYYNSEKSMWTTDMPESDSVSHTSEQELIVGLSNLFIADFENRESFLLEFYEVWYANSRYS